MTEHPIRLRNSLTGEKAAFVPRDWRAGLPEGDRRVRMYVCGPTVYDRAHIGNARPVVVFDVLFRLLARVYGAEHVAYVRNLTDIDDKIMARAAENAEPIEALTARTAGWFHEDMAALGALPPTREPRATEHVGDMVAMIATLVERGHAYAAEGHVLFAVDSYAGYGALSGRSTEDMIAGARVEVAPFKRNPMDFVLWKPSTPDQPGWDSPWGRGRPGWHIECSAMAEAFLGREFDIHGGGSDLMFPHHENEIAQSRCAHDGAGFADVWLHNGMIRVEGRKMSKSLGNFRTVADLREEAPGEVIRLALLSTHYRAELDWTGKLVADSEKALRKWRATAGEAPPGAPAPEVIDALADDLNTPAAIAALHAIEDPGTLRASAGLLGLLSDELGAWASYELVHPTRPALARDDLTQLTVRVQGTSTLEQADTVGWWAITYFEQREKAQTTKDFSVVDRFKSAFQKAGFVVYHKGGEIYVDVWSAIPERRREGVKELEQLSEEFEFYG